MSAFALRNPHDAAIAAVGLPNLAGYLLEPVLATIETAAAGKMGTVSLAALGIAEEANRLLTFGRHALSVSATPMVAAAVAAGRMDKVAEVVANGVVLAGGLGLVQLGLIRSGAGRRVVAYMTPGPATSAAAKPGGGPAPAGDGDSGGGGGGAEGKARRELGEKAAGYLRIVGLGAPAALIGHVLTGSLNGALDPVTPLAIQLSCSALRAALITGLARRGSSHGIESVGWVQAGVGWLQAGLLLAAATRKGLLGGQILRQAVGGMLGGAAGLATLAAYISAAGLLLVRTGAFQLVRQRSRF
eukprot:SAG22_NODE_1319_length_4762_cov_3.990564_2_plen_301_part_00